MNFDKQQILNQFIELLNTNYQASVRAAEMARESATHEDSAPEHQYDTFSLEASYLAHGQTMRAVELEKSIQLFNSLHLRQFDEDSPIGISALVEVEEVTKESAGLLQYYFIGPDSGGVSIEYNGTVITLITPKSPLGQKLMNKYLGDEIEITIDNKHKVLEIAGLV